MKSKEFRKKEQKMNWKSKLYGDLQWYVLTIEHLWVEACTEAYKNDDWTKADVLKDELARAGRKLYNRINR